MQIVVWNNIILLSSAIEWTRKTSGALYGLGNLYKYQGNLAEAEKMYQRALFENEKAWGPEHTSILRPVSNLRFLKASQSKQKEVEKIHHWQLDVEDEVQGTDKQPLSSSSTNKAFLNKLKAGVWKWRRDTARP